MTIWTPEDHAALCVLDAGLGGFHVLEVIEENRMTEQAPEQDQSWGDNEAEGVTYPEHHYSLADHVFTWSPKLPDGSMLVIRAQSADELVASVEAVAPLVGRLSAAWRQATGAAAPAPQAPAQQAWNQQPAQPLPNQPYPGQPAWQAAGAPQAPAPQWGGGQQAAPARQERKQYPAPQGWFKLNVPFPGGTEQLHAVAQQNQVPKGQPAKGGMYSFWGLTPGGQPGKAWYCSPQVAPVFAQFNPMPA